MSSQLLGVVLLKLVSNRHVQCVDADIMSDCVIVFIHSATVNHFLIDFK